MRPMRKPTIYLLLIMGVLTASSSLQAQEKRFDSFVDFGLPKEVKYLDSIKREEFAQEKPSLRIITSLTKLKKSNTYRLNDVHIKAKAGLNERVINSQKTNSCSLEEWVRFHSVLGSRHSQEIRKIKTGKALIIHGYEVNGVKQYFIAGDNLTCDKRFTITIEYEEKDADKAKQLVEHILKNIKFK